MSEQTKERNKTASKKVNSQSHAKAKLSPGTASGRFTVKEGDGKRPADLKKITAKQTRRLYSPVEADRIKRESGMLYAEPKTLRKARRSMVLKPAPNDPTLPKGRLKGKSKKLFIEIKELVSHIDYFILVTVVLLSCIGILAVHSATLTKGSSRFDFMQIAMTVVGFCLMLALTYIDYDVLTKNYKIILILNIVLLSVTAIFGTGADGMGDTNHNWLRIGPVGIQPAEIGKVLYIITFAAHLDAVKHRVNHIKTILGLLLHSGLIIGLVLLEKDLGQATVYIAITVVMLFAAKLSAFYFLGVGIAGLAAAPIIFSSLRDYQKQRILVGFKPEIDPSDKGYQAIQSKTAIGSGGIFGSGYRQGYLTQSVPSLLPAKQTDMIFAVIAEEFGFIGAVSVLALFTVLVTKICLNSINADKMPGSLICAGVAGMLIYQIIENVGMCLGMLPVVGITLPFLSYGGSSVLSSYLAIGLVLSVYAKNDKFYFSKGKI